MDLDKQTTTSSAFLHSAIKQLREYKTLCDKTFDRLSEDQLLYKPSNTSNSIAIIIQHMHGNMLSRWTNFLTEDGEKTWRKRDQEFEVRPLSKQELLHLWNEGWMLVFNVLTSLNEHDLLKNITIRTQPLSVINAINRQLAHYSYHTGQIVYLGKWLLSENWQMLSIPIGGSHQFNNDLQEPKNTKLTK